MTQATPLEFGLDTFGDITRDDTGRRSGAQVIRDTLAEAERAEAVGVDYFGLGEHHRPDFAISATEPLIGAILARTQRIHVGTSVTVLSSDDPIRLYQRFATLDAIAPGRAEITIGRGSFTESFPLFGFALEDYETLFEEKSQLLHLLQTQEKVSFQGRHVPALKGVTVYPRAETPLKIWRGVGGSPQSVVEAAAMDMPLVMAIIGGDAARFAPLADLYRRPRCTTGAGQGSAGRWCLGRRPGALRTHLRGGRKARGQRHHQCGSAPCGRAVSPGTNHCGMGHGNNLQ